MFLIFYYSGTKYELTNEIQRFMQIVTNSNKSSYYEDEEYINLGYEVLNISIWLVDMLDEMNIETYAKEEYGINANIDMSIDIFSKVKPDTYGIGLDYIAKFLVYLCNKDDGDIVMTDEGSAVIFIRKNKEIKIYKELWKERIENENLYVDGQVKYPE